MAASVAGIAVAIASPVAVAVPPPLPPPLPLPPPFPPPFPPASAFDGFRHKVPDFSWKLTGDVTPAAMPSIATM
jgi:hypothetical protein